MKRCLVSLVILSASFVAVAAAEPAEPAAAIVSSLTGSVWVRAPGQALREVVLFDRLPAGARLQTGPMSEVTLALRDGTRQALGTSTRVLIRTSGLVREQGRLHPLLPLPTLPRLLALAPGEEVGLRAAAVRIRAVPIHGMYPLDGATTIAGETVLSFQAVAGTPAYFVRVRAADGSTAHQITTTETKVSVPMGALQPGSRYTWEVRTVGRAGPMAEGETTFNTLSREAEEARRALATEVAQAGDAAAVALLAELDWNLGLLDEARRGMQAAFKMAPQQKTLERRLVALDDSLRRE